MLGYQIYPKYINSGVAWMGNVPEHWVPIRFKHRLLEKKKVSNSRLDAGSISFGKVIFKVAENLAPETKASYQEVLAGEFLINPLNMNYDLLSLRTALSAIDVVVSTGYIVIRSEGSLVKQYVRWLLQEFDVAHMKTLGSGVRQTINYMDIGNSFFYEPPKDEQQKISNFLDHETAKIDSLIDKQQQLITLLKEKRQAVISHAVTKGLNPNAPMRDSGVEWLGEVPAHWEVERLKFACELTSRKVHIDTKKTVALENIESWTGKYIATDSLFLGEGVEYHNGDVLFGKLRPYLAKVYFAKERGVAFGDLLVYRSKDNLLSKYCFYQMINESFINTVNSSTYGSKMPRASADFINNMQVLLPPIREQEEVLAFIENGLEKFYEIEVNAKLAITFMQERRTALISAAVTGKIDVRNWVVPQSSSNNKEVNR